MCQDMQDLHASSAPCACLSTGEEEHVQLAHRGLHADSSCSEEEPSVGASVFMMSSHVACSIGIALHVQEPGWRNVPGLTLVLILVLTV